MLPLLFGGGALAALALPASAQAHGIVGKADLPIPVWLFSWTAAIVLVVSFVALSTLWRTPQLQSEHRRRLARAADSDPNSHSRSGPLLEACGGAIGIALFVLVVYSGFAGAQVANANFSVTFIYVIFWVGIPVLSVLFGDLFASFSPWRASARLLRATLCARARARRAGAPALSSSARRVARDRRRGRVRLARARVRQSRRTAATGGAVARLLRADGHRDAAVRSRAVGRLGGRLRRVLQPALAALPADPRRARLSVPAPSTQRDHGAGAEARAW